MLNAPGDNQHLSFRELNGLRSKLNREMPAVDHEDLVLVIVLVPGGRPSAHCQLDERPVRLADDPLRPVLVDLCELILDVDLL